VSDVRFRVFAFGRQIGQPMDAAEVAAFEANLLANCCAGLADPAELVVERRDTDGVWHVDHVLNEWEPRDVFTTPVVHGG
jgi:hypothetical protein